jgi:hypothetical protein
MSVSLQKMWKENTIGVVIMFLVLAYGIYYFMGYLSRKGSFGSERMYSGANPAYKNKGNQNNQNTSSGPVPSDSLGHNEVFQSVSGGSTSTPPGLPSSCTNTSIQNPSDLLPKNNSQWAQLNPSGKGELANINLLQAGYHIGIDTIGQTLRNANLQIRSEPPNPQLYVGPWQQSTITPDFMRAPLEIGAGGLQ